MPNPTDIPLPIPCSACVEALRAVARVTEAGAVTGWCKHVNGEGAGTLLIASVDGGRIVGWQLEAPVDRARAALYLVDSCRTQDAIAEAKQASVQ